MCELQAAKDVTSRLGRWKVPLLVVGGVAAAALLAKLVSGGKGGSVVKVTGARRVAAFGDSITADGLYLAELVKHLPAGSVGKAFGYPGQGTSVIASHLPEVLAWGPTDVVVAAGVNDVAGGAADVSPYAAKLTGIWKTLKDRGIRVIAVQVLPWGGYPTYSAKGATAMAKLNAFIAQAKLPDVVVDATATMGDGSGKLRAEWKGDGLHPSPNGKAVLGRYLAQQGFGA